MRQGVEPILLSDVRGVIKELFTCAPLVSVGIMCCHALLVVSLEICIPEEELGEVMGLMLWGLGAGALQEICLSEEVPLLIGGELLLRLGPSLQTMTEDLLSVQSCDSKPHAHEFGLDLFPPQCEGVLSSSSTWNRTVSE